MSFNYITKLITIFIICSFFFGCIDRVNVPSEKTENFINDNLNFSVLVIAYLLISINIKIGINEVFEDYIHNEFYKNVAKWVISVLIIVISFLAIISMLIIRLWVHSKL